MSNIQLLKIGEFSQMMQVTVKTLRHYEQKGLLLLDEVDEWTVKSIFEGMLKNNGEIVKYGKNEILSELRYATH